MRKFLFYIVVAALSLTGCRSVSVLSFDVWRPAKVTFPPTIQRVTVVSNSAEPSEKEGNRYKDVSGKEYTLVVPHDSTTYRLAECIALDLADAHYFPEITIFYDDSITLPKGLYPLLNDTQLAAIRGGADHTAVVSLDRTDMAVNMEDQILQDDWGGTALVTNLSVATTLVLRVYWPDKVEPTTQIVNDTVSWQAFGYTPGDTHGRLPQTSEFIQEVMTHISRRVRDLFIPHEDSVERYIYTSTEPAMSDAYDYWQQQKFTEASYLWEYVYEEMKNKTNRAMAAANLAVYNELFDRYDEAIGWADKAITLFQEKSKGNESVDVAMLEEYLHQLRVRKNDNSTLQLQM
ncbi:DUF6340 family protein [Barnesiella sp. An55]|uniref:DUF6340 family protein n=1 Tax=Barnesiella sp. An55 TaxID=1965646 RepID=UPI000B3AFC21|nr:DUF6340 family protein [Barnesiella sp. An55]OUN74665.1 hypothetical protein B5G10_00090 [Barnesiella sp. An55]HIZ27053.1 hypothetical protein [Candidatus Barnesiella merdipullorum]